MAVGLLMLFGAVPALVLVILLYGAGYGISWIGRGTLPLALFGPVRFPRLMGKLAFPSLIVQACAPSAGALLIEASGSDATIGVLTLLALINVVLIGVLWWCAGNRLLTGDHRGFRTDADSCSLCTTLSENAVPIRVSAKMLMARRMRSMARMVSRE